MCARFTQKMHVFKKGKHFLFLCGASTSDNRDDLQTYLEKRRGNDSLVFRAEDIWNRIAQYPDLSALEMEEFLARLSDVVIVLVESAGAIAELGAFAISPELRSKLLVILDRQYRHDESFIKNGPVRMFDNDRKAKFRPAIYADFSVILSSAKEIRSRLEQLPSPRARSIRDFRNEPKYLLFLLCDLVAVVGPASLIDVQFYLKRLDITVEKRWIEFLLGLGEAMGLLHYIEEPRPGYFYRPLQDKRLVTFHYGLDFDLCLERAKVVSVIQRIPRGRKILTLVENAYAC